MCQIFAGSAAKIRNVLLNKPGVLESLYKRNNDGLGAMYATSKHVLRLPKIVPNTIEEARAFIRQLPNDERNLVIHFRMKTSGKIDHDNAHPFVVLPGKMAMTHNGVLSISTRSDETKCDTRHYIERYIRPMVEVCPQMAKVDAWLDVIGSDIGSNRFVLMDNEGFISYVNYHTGYEWDGLWFANTYSFDAGLLDDQFKPKPTTYTTGGYNYGGYKGKSLLDDGWDDDLPHGSNVKALPAPKSVPTVSVEKRREEIAAAFAGTVDATDSDVSSLATMTEDLWEAIALGEADVVKDYLLEYPVSTLAALFRECDYVPMDDLVSGTKMAQIDLEIMQLLVARQVQPILDFTRGAAHRDQWVAEAICWYGHWVSRTDTVVTAKFSEDASRLAVEIKKLTDERATCEAQLLVTKNAIEEEGLHQEIDEIDLELAVLKNALADSIEQRVAPDVIDVVTRDVVDEHQTAAV